jgi:uncharacterized iron-regulated membrane protein
MTEGSATRRRFQFSLRSLLVLTGVLALLLTPLAWMLRQAEQLRRAREEAIHSMVLEQRYRAEQQKRKSAEVTAIDRGGSSEAPQVTTPNSPDAAVQIDRVERENAELRKTVEILRREIQKRKDLHR